jgi:ribonuclease Z
MRITVLGSASGLPVTHRNSSCYSVDTGKHLYLLDSGEGVSRQLLRYGIDHNRIETIFISHTHSDHVSGLFMLLQMMHLTGRTNPLLIYLPEGVASGFKTVFPFFHIFKEQWSFVFEILPISHGFQWDDGGLQIEAIQNNHLAGNRILGKKYGVGSDSYSFFIQERNRKGVLYTSDVDSLAHFPENIPDIGTCIVESTHIDIQDIIRFAAQKNVQRIILTHIPHEIENGPLNCISLAESASLVAAADGLIIEV